MELDDVGDPTRSTPSKTLLLLTKNGSKRSSAPTFRQIDGSSRSELFHPLIVGPDRGLARRESAKGEVDYFTHQSGTRLGSTVAGEDCSFAIGAAASDRLKIPVLGALSARFRCCSTEL